MVNMSCITIYTAEEKVRLLCVKRCKRLYWWTQTMVNPFECDRATDAPPRKTPGACRRRLSDHATRPTWSDVYRVAVMDEGRDSFVSSTNPGPRLDVLDGKRLGPARRIRNGFGKRCPAVVTRERNDFSQLAAYTCRNPVAVENRGLWKCRPGAIRPDPGRSAAPGTCAPSHADPGAAINYARLSGLTSGHSLGPRNRVIIRKQLLLLLRGPLAKTS